MTRIIAIANQKGGTGKTTSTINLVAGLARRQQRTLLVDMDPQANATAVFLGVPFAAGPRQPNINTVYELLVNQVAASQALHRITLRPLTGDTIPATMDILPAHLDLASAELELVNAFERERRLRQALEPIQRHYDFIVIDCPPSLGLLTVNALMTATEVLIPVDTGVFPIIGLNLLRRTIQMVSQANIHLRIAGIIPTLTDRTALSRDTHEELATTFGELLLPAIPRRVAIGEAHAAGLDIFAYDPQGDSRVAYGELVAEVIRRG
ncbi:MAG: ParA family protein [Chloroflexi bacterium]|nr:ParA family protein [Chloroflexota bacterium]